MRNYWKTKNIYSSCWEEENLMERNGMMMEPYTHTHTQKKRA